MPGSYQNSAAAAAVSAQLCGYPTSVLAGDQVYPTHAAGQSQFNLNNAYSAAIYGTASRTTPAIGSLGYGPNLAQKY